MKNQLNLLSITLLFVLVLGGILTFSAVSDLKKEKEALEQELQNMTDANFMNMEVFQQAESYLRALMKGNAADYMTENYIQEVESFDYGSSNETANLENLDIYNISVRPNEDETFTVYAIFLAQLGGTGERTDNPANYRSMLLTTKLQFVQENGEFKVNDSELQPIETSSDFFNDLLQNE